MSCDAHLCPHQGQLVLRKSLSDGVWRAGHLVTGEVMLLPPPRGEWDMLFDAEGFAHIVDDNEEVIMLENRFQMSLYSIGGKLIINPQDKRHEFGLRYIEDDKSKFDMVRVTLPIGQEAKEVAFSVVQFRCSRRPGQVFFWSIADFYYGLNFSQLYQGHASRWYGARWKSWENFLESSCLPESLIKSLRGTHTAEEQAGALDRASVGTYGFVALLVLWAFPGLAGTMRSALHRLQCESALVALVQAVCYEEWELQLFVGKGVVWEWPLPPDGEQRISVTVSVDGALPLESWAVAFKGAGVEAPGDMDNLRAEGQSKMSLVAMLAHMCKQPSYHHVVMQVVWAIGKRVELTIMEALEGEGGQLNGGGTVELQGLGKECNPRQVDKALVGYWHAGREIAQQEGAATLCSMAVDKSAVGGRRVFNGFVAVPSNEVGDDEGLENAKANTRKRSLAWLQKDSEGQWRAKKRHRVASSEWVMEVDSQLRAGISVGLSHYAPPEEGQARPADATTWPLLQLCFDGGSDGHCAVHWLQRAKKFNIDEAPDISHGLHRDLELTISRCGLSLHQKLMRITWNVHLGPWGQHERYQQTVQCLEEAFATMRPTEDALFMSMILDILYDLDMEHRAGEENIEDVVWELMQTDSPFAKKGRMTDANRYIATVREGKRQHKSFHMKKYAYLRLSLEMDFLRGDRVKRLRLGSSGSAADAGDEGQRRQTGQTSAEELALRGACANAMAVATMILADRENQYRQGCISAMMKPWDKWHSHQSETLRSTKGSVDWCLEQVGGGLLETCASTFKMLADIKELRRCGLLGPKDYPPEVVGDEAALHGHTAFQNDLSTLVGNLCLHMCGMRLRRVLWLVRGWPSLSVAFLGDNKEAALSRLKQDFRNFEWLGELDSAAAARLYDRHIFHLVCNEQLLSVLRATRWELTEAVLQWVRRRSLRLLATQGVEDAFNVQRRQETTQSNLTTRNASYFYSLVSKGVLHTKHGFDEAKVDQVSLAPGAVLPNSAYEPSPATCSIKAHEIIGTTSSVPWYTAGAFNHGVVYGDLELIDYCRSHNIGDKFDDAEVFGCLLRVERMMIRRVGANANPGPWLMSLGDLSTTAAPAWEMQEVTVPGMRDTIFVPKTSDPVMRWIIPVDADSMQAFRFEWKSPQWCDKHLGRIMNQVPKGVVAGRVTNIEPWVSACARQGFGDLTKTNLSALCRRLGVKVVDTSSLFNVSFELVKHVLEVGDEQAVNLLSKKVAAMQVHHQPGVSELMALDEGNCGINKDEIDEMKKKKEATACLIKDVADFTEEWREKKKAVAPKAAPRQGGRAAGSAGGGTRPSRKKGGGAPPPFPLCDLTQSVCKPFCPEKGFLWKAASGSWQCHFDPGDAHFPRRSFSWRVYGDRRAAMLALKQLWTDYNTYHGRAAGECPWPEIMAVDCSLTETASAAASSS